MCIYIFPIKSWLLKLQSLLNRPLFYVFLYASLSLPDFYYFIFKKDLYAKEIVKPISVFIRDVCRMQKK